MTIDAERPSGRAAERPSGRAAERPSGGQRRPAAASGGQRPSGPERPAERPSGGQRSGPESIWKFSQNFPARREIVSNVLVSAERRPATTTTTSGETIVKVKPKDYDRMKTAVETVLSDNPNVTVETYLSQGLTAKRFRWDALIIANRRKLFDICALYSYCNDTHIDTALRRITGTK